MHTEASAARFSPSLTGNVALDPTTSSAAGDVDLEGDLDLGDEQSAMVHAGVEVLGLRLSGYGYETSQRGDGFLTTSFGDISAGTDVDVDFDLTSIQAALTYGVLTLGMLDVHAGVAVDYLDVSLEVTDDGTGLAELVAAKSPIPLVFFEADVYPPGLPLRVQLRMGGIAGSYDAFEGSLVDGELYVRWLVSAPIEVYAGYRLLHFDLEGADDGQAFESSVELDGWVLGAGFSL